MYSVQYSLKGISSKLKAPAMNTWSPRTSWESFWGMAIGCNPIELKLIACAKALFLSVPICIASLYGACVDFSRILLTKPQVRSSKRYQVQTHTHTHTTHSMISTCPCTRGPLAGKAICIICGYVGHTNPQINSLRFACIDFAF